MSTCPLSGGACPHPKNAIHKLKAGDGSIHSCQVCTNCHLAGGVSQVAQISIFPLGPDLSNLVTSLMEKVKNIDHCPSCGMTLRQFQESGKFGCDGCYSYFQDVVTPLIHKVQDGAIAQSTDAKRPKHSADRAEDGPEIGLIQARLDEAVRQENYEAATIYRDVIRLLRSVPEGPSRPNGTERQTP
jgi:protein-arginine kinase activator protein McsA